MSVSPNSVFTVKVSHSSVTYWYLHTILLQSNTVKYNLNSILLFYINFLHKRYKNTDLTSRGSRHQTIT